jgi:hypothetical protein
VTLAIDARDPRHIAVAADPYRNPTRIVMATTVDGGRTWERPIELLPPGFAKSYDPVLAFAADRSVIIVGGASQADRRPRCQPGSAIFGARLRSAGPEYFLVRPAEEGVYVDRPSMAVDGATGTVAVAWTASSGPNAECRGMPATSSTQFSRSASDGSFAQPRALPSSGLPAPFGSSITWNQGELAIAVGERDTTGMARIVVTTSPDVGSHFTDPQILAGTALIPTAIAGLGGFVTAVPSIAAGPGGRLAVAWAAPTATGSTVGVAERRDGIWAPQVLLPASGAFALSPTVAFDEAARLWLLSAHYDTGVVRFLLRAASDRWAEPLEVATAPGGGYREIGQFLGPVAQDGRVAAAVPLDGSTTSSLLLWTAALPDER